MNIKPRLFALLAPLAAGVSFLSGGPLWAEPDPFAAPAVTQSASIGDEIVAQWQAGDKGAAEKRLDAWMESDEKSPEPWVTAARLRFEEKKYKKTISLADTALKKSPQSAEAYYWRGRAYESMGKLMEAANEYRAALLAKKGFQSAELALNGVNARLNPSGTPAAN